MRLAVLWSELSGYTLDCWSALASLGVEIEALCSISGAGSNAPFDLREPPGVKISYFDEGDPKSGPIVEEFVSRARPTVLLVSGWWNAHYRHAAAEASIPYIVACDNPYRDVIQSSGLRLRHGRFLRGAAAVAVPGERGFQLINRSGIAPGRIFRPLYGIATSPPDTKVLKRDRAFLFVGQLIERKGIPELLSAYAQYRLNSADPLALYIAGTGPLETLRDGQEGVEWLGFVQPSELASLRSKCPFLVLPSHHDAWPLALVEAAADGMGILCTTACGSSVEIVRSGWNGRVFPPKNVAALAEALQWADAHIQESDLIGERSRQLAAPYSAEQWAEEWNHLLTSASEGQCL